MTGGPSLPPMPPELIVCRDANHAQHVRRQIGHVKHIRVIGPATVQNISGIAPWRITVCEGVSLYRDVQGEGALGALLRSRQKTWGDKAVFVTL